MPEIDQTRFFYLMFLGPTDFIFLDLKQDCGHILVLKHIIIQELFDNFKQNKCKGQGAVLLS